MAFSNYIATSALMTALFYGWGLGLFGTIGPTRQWLIVGATWLVLTGWSTLWLRHFRRGPLEWLVALPDRRTVADQPDFCMIA
ncbi:DUF418 domain-containing protein [Novosphingobium colocasiae]